MKPGDLGAIVSAYTGVLLGDFEKFHEYVEKLVARPVYSHEMRDEGFMAKIKDLAKEDFLKIHEWCSDAHSADQNVSDSVN